MHRAKGQVHTDDHQPEVGPTPRFTEGLTKHLRPPVVKAGEDTENRPTKQHIVEVGHDVVGIGLLSVGRGNRVRHARQSAHGELNDQTNGKQHGCGEAQLATPHGQRPVNDLDSGWHSNGHSGHGEHRHRHRPET